MKQLRRERCAVLPLVLKGKWYDMIACGKKLEEYRDESKYWRVRIGNWWDKMPGLHVVEFRRGYRKDAPKMWFVVGGVLFRFSGYNYTWGESMWPHFAIALGERVELVDEEKNPVTEGSRK